MNRRTGKVSRREFIAAAGTALAMADLARAARQGVSIALDPKEPLATPPVRWAAKELRQSLESRGLSVSSITTVDETKAGDLCVLVAPFKQRLAARVFGQARTNIAPAPEATGLASGMVGKMHVVIASGCDERGLVYSLLELADRVRNSADPAASLAVPAPIMERPANEVRSMSRLFTSDVEDKPWYNDREMWPEYLTMLATQRFNRFNLAFGIGYDFLRQVTDAYFLFAYPFLLSVPGYNVRASNLPDQERNRNLEMLQFISEQTAARGMEFQLGLWMHGYEWIDTQHANYTIEGLSNANHKDYCHDAVRLLLQKCPAISGLTFRVHGESGVQEGSYEFWKAVFDGVGACGRPVRIDLHAKGMNQSMLDMTVATGQEVTLSPKFWAEHMGMTYHQADIREIEQPKPGNKTNALMNLSEGSRRFLRYGYGDLLREDRPWKVVHRIWPGTQRLLLWGDPVTASAYSKEFSFCGSEGVEIFEPLSFKGRRGSGIAGNRCAYADSSLVPRWDWQKYLYTYRVWGRALYNPETDSSVWRRYLSSEFNQGAGSVESALANASRILPIVTTAHGASAGNNMYWPEVYLNMSLVDAAHYGPYTDTPSPRVFGNVSPLDPQLFARINDYADRLLKQEPDSRYSPIEAAHWIEDYADAALKHLAEAESKTTGKERPEYRRFVIDVKMEAGIGTFFGAKFRSGILYRIWEQTGDPAALRECLNQYRKARNAWAELSNQAKGIYVSDITVGELPQLRGHWLDRLPAIDQDIAAIEAKASTAHGESKPEAAKAIETALGRPVRATLSAKHTPASSFEPGKPLAIDLLLAQPVHRVNLYYRRVTQAERFKFVEMTASASQYKSSVPADYTASAYPLQYYFDVQITPQESVLYPGLSAALTQQPYFVVRQPGSARKLKLTSENRA